MSKEVISSEQRAQNFIALLIQHPGLVLSDNRHLLHRFQAFIAGLRWANAFNEANDRELYDFLCNLESKLTSKFLDSDSGVGWIDELMNRTGGDEQLAFGQLVSTLSDLATKEGVI